jgi:hypothetical protein
MSPCAPLASHAFTRPAASGAASARATPQAAKPSAVASALIASVKEAAVNELLVPDCDTLTTEAIYRVPRV